MTVTYYAEILLQYELSWYFVLYHNILIYIHKGLGKQYMATIVDREEKEQEGCSHVTLCQPFSKRRAFNSCCQTKYRSHVCLFSFAFGYVCFHRFIILFPSYPNHWSDEYSFLLQDYLEEEEVSMMIMVMIVDQLSVGEGGKDPKNSKKKSTKWLFMS